MTDIPDLIARLEGHERHAVHDYDDDCEEAAQALRDLQAVAEEADFIIRGIIRGPHTNEAKRRGEKWLHDSFDDLIESGGLPEAQALAKLEKT